mmetsp:Transcript_15783/g.30251  ORF Transcript_15783/g.30251 Transcript_15783/m.30251 type:complete len:224 (+) Transcript_15783:1804-2475(+)
MARTPLAVPLAPSIAPSTPALTAPSLEMESHRNLPAGTPLLCCESSFASPHPSVSTFSAAPCWVPANPRVDHVRRLRRAAAAASPPARAQQAARTASPGAASCHFSASCSLAACSSRTPAPINLFTRTSNYRSCTFPRKSANQFSPPSSTSSTSTSLAAPECARLHPRSERSKKMDGQLCERSTDGRRCRQRVFHFGNSGVWCMCEIEPSTKRQRMQEKIHRP